MRPALQSMPKPPTIETNQRLIHGSPATAGTNYCGRMYVKKTRPRMPTKTYMPARGLESGTVAPRASASNARPAKGDGGEKDQAEAVTVERSAALREAAGLRSPHASSRARPVMISGI